MFRGSFEVSLTAGGQMVLPAIYRQSLHEADHGRVVVMRGTVAGCPCLEIVSASIHKANAAASMPGGEDDTDAAYRRFQLASACALQLDRRGRMHLPSNLRDYAHLGSRVLVLARVASVVVIDPQAWARIDAETTEILT